MYYDFILRFYIDFNCIFTCNYDIVLYFAHVAVKQFKNLLFGTTPNLKFR